MEIIVYEYLSNTPIPLNQVMLDNVKFFVNDFIWSQDKPKLEDLTHNNFYFILNDGTTFYTKETALKAIPLKTHIVRTVIEDRLYDIKKTEEIIAKMNNELHQLKNWLKDG